MTTAEMQARRHDPHTYETLGRVTLLLCDAPGPLVDRSVGFHVWRTLSGDGYVLAWSGDNPTEDEVVEYLLDAAADDELTLTLRPGDVHRGRNPHYTEIEVQGVLIQLRAEPTTRTAQRRP